MAHTSFFPLLVLEYHESIRQMHCTSATHSTHLGRIHKHGVLLGRHAVRLVNDLGELLDHRGL